MSTSSGFLCVVLRYMLLMILYGILLAKGNSPFEVTPKTNHAAIMTQAQFDCRARAHALGWFLDGLFANSATLVLRNASYHVQHLPDGTVHSTFFIRAIRENNNSRIECQVQIIGTGIIMSGSAILLVQGRLAAPHNFTILQHGDGFIEVRWNHPFTLEGVPIQCFNLYWRNLDTNEEGNITLLPHVSEVTLTIHNLTTSLTPEQPTPGVKYEFRISATNAVGEGHNSTAEQGYLQQEDSDVPQLIPALFSVFAVLVLVAAILSTGTIMKYKSCRSVNTQLRLQD